MPKKLTALTDPANFVAVWDEPAEEPRRGTKVEPSGQLPRKRPARKAQRGAR